MISSSTTTSPSTSTSASTSGTTPPGPQSGGHRGISAKVVAGLVAGGLVIAAVATGLTLTLSSPTPGTTGTTSAAGSGHHDHARNPSAAISTLQEELGQLNYYGGPVTGYLNRGTEQAITYLQRDAGLPQTGRMDPATQRALDEMLTNGNNQMGGNGHPGPSAAITKLQQELGQLNYYEGPVTGRPSPATTAAIVDLQRDAHISQTGLMNHTTRLVLDRMLANGDNQMGG